MTSHISFREIEYQPAVACIGEWDAQLVVNESTKFFGFRCVEQSMEAFDHDSSSSEIFDPSPDFQHTPCIAVPAAKRTPEKRPAVDFRASGSHKIWAIPFNPGYLPSSIQPRRATPMP